MSRKDKPLKKRIVSSVGSLALIGVGGYMFFAGANMLLTGILVIALLSICTPVIVEGGSIFEIIGGFFEAFLEGLLSIVDAIASVFSS